VAADCRRRDRLRRWDLPASWIKALENRGRLRETVPLIAPGDAILISRPPAPGSAFSAGQTLLRLADPERLWVEAEVYPPDFDLLQPGMEAQVVLPGPPVRKWRTRLDLIYPFMDDATRSGRIRLILTDPEGRLSPGRYVEVRLRADLGHRLVVAAVIVAFLGRLRSAAVVVLTLPVAVWLAFIPMNLQHLSAYIMSLGGIAVAIGAMVDAAIVIVANIHRRLGEKPGDRLAVMIGARGGRFVCRGRFRPQWFHSQRQLRIQILARICSGGRETAGTIFYHCPGDQSQQRSGRPLIFVSRSRSCWKGG